MGFTQRCFIRKNTPKLQEELRYLGYEICSCCNFKDADWLSAFPENGTVHGVGYADETVPMSKEEELALFLYYKSDKDIDCGENEQLFLAIAAMRDDTNDKQVFVNEEGDWGIYSVSSDNEGFDGIDFYTMPKNSDLESFHKASVEELKLLFKK